MLSILSTVYQTYPYHIRLFSSLERPGGGGRKLAILNRALGTAAFLVAWEIEGTGGREGGTEGGREGGMLMFLQAGARESLLLRCRR